MSALPTQQLAEGWRASLELRALSFRQDRRTRLAHRAHRGPLLVQRAFYPESAPDSISPSTCSSAEPCHVYLIHPPGGVVSGDELSLEVEVQADGACAADDAGGRQVLSTARCTRRAAVADACVSMTACSSGCRRRISTIRIARSNSIRVVRLEAARASSAGRSAASACRPVDATLGQGAHSSVL